jgi:hypothetical protein
MQEKNRLREFREFERIRQLGRDTTAGAWCGWTGAEASVGGRTDEPRAGAAENADV